MLIRYVYKREGRDPSRIATTETLAWKSKEGKNTWNMEKKEEDEKKTGFIHCCMQ